MKNSFTKIEGDDIVEVDTKYGKFYGKKGDLITEHLVNFSAHTRNEISMVLDHIDDSDVVVDIGAHIGTYTIPIAQKLKKGGGKIYAIEGNPETFSLLKKNVAINAISNIAEIELGIVGLDGTTFSHSSNPNNTGSTYFKLDTEGNKLSTIDLNYFFKTTVGSVDFIKMDIEGLELFALDSIESIIDSYRPKLYVEISKNQLERYGNTPDQIFQILKEYNYEFYRNVGKRNSDTDDYIKKQIFSFDALELFDVLALPRNDE